MTHLARLKQITQAKSSGRSSRSGSSGSGFGSLFFLDFGVGADDRPGGLVEVDVDVVTEMEVVFPSVEDDGFKRNEKGRPLTLMLIEPPAITFPNEIDDDAEEKFIGVRQKKIIFIPR